MIYNKEYKLGWGIIGLGKIAHKFASDLSIVNTCYLVAVASRDKQRARDFLLKHMAVRSYDSYVKLVNDQDVDVVYIATPHVFHYKHSLLCLKHRKHVLCEKPMGMNTVEVEKMVKLARDNNLFLMEGMWSRFFPATERLIDLVHKKQIGEIVSISADFGFKGDPLTQKRLYDKKLGGGSILDIGIYPLYFSLLLFGYPDRIEAMARYTETGVDSYCNILLEFSNGSIGNFMSTIEYDSPTELIVYGTTGYIKLHRRFHHASHISINRIGTEELIELPYEAQGYQFEIEEVVRCLSAGKVQSSKHSLEDSIRLARLLDQVLLKIGLSYS